MNEATRIEKWELELARLRDAARGRWGECRRFAGRSAGIRLERIGWLTRHISEAEDEKRHLEQMELTERITAPHGGCFADQYGDNNR